MTLIAAYESVGLYRGAAAICGTTPKTVKRVISQSRPAGHFSMSTRMNGAG